MYFKLPSFSLFTRSFGHSLKVATLDLGFMTLEVPHKFYISVCAAQCICITAVQTPFSFMRKVSTAIGIIQTFGRKR